MLKNKLKHIYIPYVYVCLFSAEALFTQIEEEKAFVVLSTQTLKNTKGDFLQKV